MMKLIVRMVAVVLLLACLIAYYYGVVLKIPVRLMR